MGIDLENRLQQYAHNLVADHLKAEYEYQISKWESEIDHVVDARQAALEKMQSVLQVGIDQATATKQSLQNSDLAVASFLIFAGPAVSWLAGKVQYDVIPRFTGKLKTKWATLRGSISYETEDKWLAVELGQWDYNKVHAKVFGDITKGVAQFGIDRLIKPNSSQPGPDVQNAIKRVISSPNTLSFKTNLRDALRIQANLLTKTIMSLAMKINEDRNYGADCLKRLYQKNPRARHVPPNQQETMAKAMIVRDFDRQRETWADEWFYYGRNPSYGVPGLLIEPMELEMWAMWILQEEFKVKIERHQPAHDSKEYALLIGRDGYNLTWAQAVQERLKYFGILKRVRVGIDTSDIEGSDKEELRRKRGEPGPKKDRPPKKDESLDLGILDNAYDVRMLEHWATFHPLRSTGRRSYRRSIGSILNVHNS